MTEQNKPNQASQKSKAEGDRMQGGDMAGANQQGGGITNRPKREEDANQEALPERGESKPGVHAGHGGDSSAGEKDRS